MSESIAPIDSALLPAAVRNGDAQRKQDYKAALAFERALVSQMTEAMTKSFGGLDDDETGDAASKQLKQSLPDTLADALMAGGGIGLAAQLDQMWHPAAASTSVSKTATAQAQQSGGGATAGGSATA